MNEEQESQGPHHHRHRKDDDESNGRPGRGRHGGRSHHHGRRGRNRHNRHFRFNMTEARRWDSVSGRFNFLKHSQVKKLPNKSHEH